jgi:hypothetical protein
MIVSPQLGSLAVRGFEILIHLAMSGPKIGGLRLILAQLAEKNLPDELKKSFPYTRM